MICLLKLKCEKTTLSLKEKFFRPKWRWIRLRKVVEHAGEQEGAGKEKGDQEIPVGRHDGDPDHPRDPGGPPGGEVTPSQFDRGGVGADFEGHLQRENLQKIRLGGVSFILRPKL